VGRATAAVGWAVLAAVAAVGVLLALLALVAAAPFARPFVASRVVKVLDDAIAGRLELAGVEVLSRGGIELRGLEVYDPHGHLVVSVGRARVFADLTGLRSRAIGISAELESPSVVVEEEADGGVSLARAFAPARPAPERPGERETGTGWTVHVSRLAIRQGEVWWVDPEGETRLEASGVDVDGRGLYGPRRARVDLRLRGALSAPVAAPVALELVGGLSGDAVRVPVLRVEVGGTALAAVGEGSLATGAGRVAVSRLGIAREVARALVPTTPAGDDLVAVGYVESDGAIATAAVRAEPAEGARGRADAAVAARLAAPAAAVGFDVVLEAFDPARLVARAPPGDVTLAAHGAAAGSSLKDLRGRLEATVARSRLRGGEVTRAEIVARADRGALSVSRASVSAPGVAANGAMRWREGGKVSGRAAVAASDLRVALANLGALLGEKLDFAAGRARIAVTLGGTSASPVLAGTVDAPRLGLGGVSLSGTRLEGSVTGPARTASATVAGTIALVRVGGDVAVRTVALRGGLDDESASVVATATVPGFRDPAALEARGRLGPGRTSLRLSDLRLAWPGTRWTLAAPATVVFSGPTVDRLELASGDQRITVSGGLGRRGKLDARAEIAGLDLARLPAGLLPADAAARGALSADVRATGRAARPEVSATVSLSAGAWRGVHGLSAVGQGSWSSVKRRARGSLALSRADGGAADVEADLPVPLAARPGARIAARIRVVDVPLEEALSAEGSDAPLAGRLSVDASLEGTAAAPSLRGTVALEDAAAGDLDGLAVDVTVEGSGETLRATARAALASGGIVAAEAGVPLDLADLLASPARALRALRSAPLEGSARLSALELAPLAGRAGVPRAAAGTVDGVASFAGSIARPRGSASLSLAGGAIAGVRELGATVDLALTDAAVAVTGRATAAGAEALRVEASLGLPVERLASRAALRGAPLRAAAVVTGLSLQRAATEDVPLAGAVSGRLTAEGTPRAPRVTLSAEGEGVAIAGRPLGAARLEARYAGARGSAEVLLRPTAGGTLRGTLAVEADLGLDAPPRPLGDAPAELAAVAEGLDLGFLPAVAPDLIRSAAGKLDANVTARGPLARMSPRGTLRVQDGQIAIVEYGDLTGVAVDASVGDDAVELSRLEARRGSGRITARGWLRGLASDRARLEAHLTSDRFTVVRAGQDVATVDAQVDATGTYAGGELAIEVRVPSGVVVLPERSPRALQSLERRGDIVVGRREVRRRAAAAHARAPAPASRSAAARPFALTAHVVVPRNLFVKSDDPEIDVELKADVRYERVGGEDYAQGSVEVVRGRVEPIGGRSFEIEHGKAQFTGGPPSAALLDVQARYDNPAAVVTVKVQGPARKPEIRLESKPPMDDAQIAVFLATGRTELKAGAGGVGTLTGEEAGRAALAALATQAFKDLVADKLPLDTVALDPSALRAGKYVTDKIYVGYTRRFEADPERGENVDEVRVEYQITPRWTFESRYGNAQSGGASLIWSRDY
jgi:translocation and assembly module TamB